MAPADTDADAAWLAEKICALRIFEDDAGKMNRSLRDFSSDSQLSTLSTQLSRSGSQPSALSSEPSAPDSQLSTLSSQLPPPAASLLVVSQFTLFASTRKGTRPSFNDAAQPDHAIPLYESFLRRATAALGRPVASGQFGAKMEVSLINDGPVTLVIDSHRRE